MLHVVHAQQQEEIGGFTQGRANFSVKFCPYIDPHNRTWKRCRMLKKASTARMKLRVHDLAASARLVANVNGTKQLIRWKRHNGFPWPVVTQEYCPYPVPGGAGAGFGSLFARAAGTIMGDRVTFRQTEAGAFGYGYLASACA